MKDRICGRDEF